MKFNIEFIEMSHGWLSFVMDNGNDKLMVDASDAYYDTIDRLFEILIGISTGRSGSIEWCLEPDIYNQSFDVDGPYVSTKVIGIRENSIETPTLFEWEGKVSDLLKEYMTLVQSLVAAYDVEHAWSWPLQEEKLKALKQLVSSYS